jgi:hypothetical protein
MDAEQFDRIARVLGSGASRRRVLHGLVGGALGGAAVASRRSDAAAKGKRCGRGSDCPPNQICPDGNCTSCRAFTGSSGPFACKGPSGQGTCCNPGGFCCLCKEDSPVGGGTTTSTVGRCAYGAEGDTAAVACQTENVGNVHDCVPQ